MNKTAETSFAILKQEFRVQFVTAGFLFVAFTASILLKRCFSSYEDELPKLFIVFYAAIFGFTLPWQINTKGHIVPEYCRYNLNLPVHTWQLIALPLLSRLLLIFVFIAFEFGFHGILYSFCNSRHVNIYDMIYYAKISVLIYLLLQAFAWSKDSVKNLFLWVGIALGILVFMNSKALPRIFDADLLWGYCLCVAVLLALAVVGVRNLRKGLIFGLPGFKSIPALFDRKKVEKEKSFSTPRQAQFHHEWKRSWYIMPGIVLIAIAISHIIAMKMDVYSFFKDVSTVLIVFFATVFIAPILGFTFSGRSFSGVYSRSLPIKSRTLAAVRLKVFSLSYVLSLGIFFFWISYKLFIDGRLLRAIHSRNQELLHSPGVIVWILAAFLIWAFVIAFTMVSVALQKKSLFTVIIILLIMAFFLFPHWMLPEGVRALCIRFYSCPYAEWPRYPEFFSFVNVLIAGWLCLAWLRTKSPAIKFPALVAVCLLAVLYTIICGQYIYLILLPLILLFPYTLFVITQEINLKRYEFCGKKIMPSWRLALAAGLIMTGFSLYTLLLNAGQRKELDGIVEKCAAANAKNPVIVEKTKMKIEDYVRRNMPFKETLLPDWERYLKESGEEDFKKRGWKSSVKVYLNQYLLKTARRMNRGNQHNEALKLTELFIDLNIKYRERFWNYNFDDVLVGFLRNSGATEKELVRINFLLRKMLSGKLYETKKHLNTSLSFVACAKVANTFSTFGREVYHYSICEGYQSGKQYLTFTQAFFSPLCFCDSINYAKTTLTAIDCMNYIQDGKTMYNNRKVNNLLLPFRVYEYESVNYLLKLIAAVAMAQYRLENGKEPENLKQLVPEYLRKGETYLIHLSFYGSATKDYYQPFLKADSIDEVQRYLGNQYCR